MGYCPYYCIKCKCIVDNGWDNTTYSAQRASEITGKSIETFINVLDSDDRITLSICNFCVDDRLDSNSDSDRSYDDWKYELMEQSKVDAIFQQKFMKIVKKMKKFKVPMPDEFRLYYLIEKYIEDDTCEKPDTIFKIKPCLTKEEANEYKEELPNGKEKETDNRTRETSIITNDESTFEGGIPYVDEGRNKQTIVFSALHTY